MAEVKKRRTSVKRNAETPAPEEVSHISDSLIPLAVPIGSVTRDTRNLKTHGERDLAAQLASIKKWKVYRPAIAQKSTGRIVVGNGMHEALESAGFKWIPVEFKDLTDSEADELAFTDNATATIAEWNDEALVDVAAQLDASLRETGLAGVMDLVLENLDLPSLEELAEQQRLMESQGELPEDADGDGEASVGRVYKVTVLCEDEAHQTKVFNRLQKLKLNVSLSTRDAKP